MILAIVALLGPGSVYHACIAAIVNSNRPTAYSSQYLIVCLYFLTAVALQLHSKCVQHNLFLNFRIDTRA